MAMEYTISSGECEKDILRDIVGHYSVLKKVENVLHASYDIHVRMQFAARYALSKQDSIAGNGAMLVFCRHSPVSGSKRRANDDPGAIAYCLLNVPPEFQKPLPGH